MNNKIKSTDYELFIQMLKRMELRIQSLEDLLTIVTRVLVSKGVYTIEEAFDEYGQINRERATENYKFNLEAEINVEE